MTLLMTATLAPPPGVVKRSDPALRLADYLESLRFHLGVPSQVVDRILFVDNSDGDLGPLEEMASRLDHDKTVELISFAGNDHPPSYGKAFGEFKLIDFGLAQTSLLRDTDIVWKITGRLRCRNLAELISAAPARYDVLCDLHTIQTFGIGRVRLIPWMDLRLFSCTVAAYNAFFRGSYLTLQAKFSARHLYGVVLGARRTYHVIPRFPRQPEFAGVSGQSATEYDSRSLRVKRQVRAGLRRAVPWLWL